MKERAAVVPLRHTFISSVLFEERLENIFSCFPLPFGLMTSTSESSKVHVDAFIFLPEDDLEEEP